jgi:hypothetical protein
MAVTSGTQVLHSTTGAIGAVVTVNGHTYRSDATGRIHDVLAADLSGVRSAGFQDQDPRVLNDPNKDTSHDKWGRG